MTWLQKYEPTKPEDLVFNINKLKSLPQLVKKHSLIIIKGSRGIGKTISVKTLLNQFNLHTLNFDIIKKQDPCNFNKRETCNTNNKEQTLDYYISKIPKNSVILIDDINTIITNKKETILKD